MTTRRLVVSGRPAAFLVALLLSLTLLAGCNGDEDTRSDSAPPSSSQQEDPVPEENTLPHAPEGINPLTGQAAPEGYTADMRPVAVMVANDSRALPQRGLAAASVIFEMETEGGITRLMALYPSLASVPTVGPVRSTRDQFLQFALPEGAILSHIGTSIYAENLLNHLAYQDLDGIYLGTSVYSFDWERTMPRPGGKLNEHCWFTDSSLLAAGVEQLSMPTTGDTRQLFLFSGKEPKTTLRAQQIDVVYTAASSAGFIFSEETGLYTKTILGSPHADEDGTALTYKNVIVLSCPVSLKPDGQCTEFDLTEGTGTFFTMGDATSIRWVKGGPQDPLRLYTLDGKELEIQPGKTFVIVISQSGGSVSYGKFEAPASSTTEAQ